MATPSLGTGQGQRQSDRVESGGDKNKMLPIASNPRGGITVAATLELGLKVTLGLQRPYQFAAPTMPDISVYQEVSARFVIEESGDEVCLSGSAGSVIKSNMKDGAGSKWAPGEFSRTMVAELAAAKLKCFTGSSAKLKRNEEEVSSEDDESEAAACLKKRQGNFSGPPYYPGSDIPSVTINLDDSRYGDELRLTNCGPCMRCVDYDTRGPCCGCAFIPPDNYLPPDDPARFGSIPNYPPSPVAKRAMLDARAVFEPEKAVRSGADSLNFIYERAANDPSPGRKDVTLPWRAEVR